MSTEREPVGWMWEVPGEGTKLGLSEPADYEDVYHVTPLVPLEAAAPQPAHAEPQQEALAEMEARKDAAYLERNQVVAALAKCFPSGVARTAIEGWSEDWHGCVYIDLPTGQASWHFHDSQAYLFDGLQLYTKAWDGHSTEEKYRRLASLAAPPAAQPDMPAICAALGFDPTNHHNAARCPYCTPRPTQVNGGK
jgi:hypothetical protein